MSHSDRDQITALASDQLPLAARFGLGRELDQLADAIMMDEQPVHLATASIDGKFGVLALTTRRLVWVPEGRSTKAVAWPTRAAHVRTRGKASSITVTRGDHTSELSAILPAAAADDLAKRLGRNRDAVMQEGARTASAGRS